MVFCCFASIAKRLPFCVLSRLGCFTFFVYVRCFFSSPLGAPKVPLRIPANDHFLPRLSSDLGGVELFRIHKHNNMEESCYFKIAQAPTYATPPTPFHNIGLESSSTGSSFPLWWSQSPFLWPWFSSILGRDSEYLFHPFMRVTHYMTRHLATLRES